MKLNKIILLLIWLMYSKPLIAQVAVNLVLESPPFLHTIGHGKNKKPPFFIYEPTRNLPALGVEFSNLFSKSWLKGFVKVNTNIGFLYTNPTYLGVDVDNRDEFLSEVKNKIINIPLVVRGMFKLSELIDNNYFGIELGLQGHVWLYYKLKELASIKIRDLNGDIIGETIFSDKGDLIENPGDKFGISFIGGLFIYVKRFFISYRITATITDMYSGKLKNNWNVPFEYSIYESKRAEGKMKQFYGSLVIAFRITQ